MPDANTKAFLDVAISVRVGAGITLQDGRALGLLSEVPRVDVDARQSIATPAHFDKGDLKEAAGAAAGVGVSS